MTPNTYYGRVCDLTGTVEQSARTTRRKRHAIREIRISFYRQYDNIMYVCQTQHPKTVYGREINNLINGRLKSIESSDYDLLIWISVVFEQP